MNNEIVDEISLSAEEIVMEGYEEEARIVYAIQEYIKSEHGTDYYLEHIEQVVADKLEKHRQNELRWHEPTDCDRVTAAFKALSEQGVATSENFMCCQMHGGMAMAANVAAQTIMGNPCKGFVFFSNTDVEIAIEEGRLPLCFGAAHGGPEELGTVIVEALRQAGLTVNWEPFAYRIEVKVDWKRRRFTPSPPLLTE